MRETRKRGGREGEMEEIQRKGEMEERKSISFARLRLKREIWLLKMKA